jgi:hypothetical protein
MRTISKAVFALCLLWNVGALARQPTPHLPDPLLTPGGAFDVTLQDIRAPGYSKKVRAVTKGLREQAFNRYGIASDRSGEYQIDHLIPLSLGGSNSIMNLWPMPHGDARAKDALEKKLLKLVRSGQLDLHSVQREIAADWTQAYQKYMVSAAAPPQPLLQPAASENEVWVNTRSGKYWKPGSHFFGKTKQGQYMAEGDAISHGYQPARGTGY